MGPSSGDGGWASWLGLVCVFHMYSAFSASHATFIFLKCARIHTAIANDSSKVRQGFKNCCHAFELVNFVVALFQKQTT